MIHDKKMQAIVGSDMYDDLVGLVHEMIDALRKEVTLGPDEFTTIRLTVARQAKIDALVQLIQTIEQRA